MQIQWYGDNPDIAKWALALMIASLNRVERIVHVAMWTDGERGDYPYLIRLPGATASDSDFTPFVTDHFRKLDGVRSLALDFGIEIEVWPYQFSHETRTEYFRKVRDAIVASNLPTLWLFDPDNGIKPEGGGKPADQFKYISLPELSYLHTAASERNHIAVYQHNTRRPHWPQTARRRLQGALNGHGVDVYESAPTMLEVR